MFERIYIEIGNICNLNCSFCTGTKREKRQMTLEEFKSVCGKIKGYTKYIYLHVLGEPLLHPMLNEFLKIAAEAELCVCITTNGTLLSENGGILLSNKDVIHKISISLHSIEGNGKREYTKYLKNAVRFAKDAKACGIYTVFRLWNSDSDSGKGKNSENANIEEYLRQEFPCEWQKRPRGYRIDERIFLEYDGIFTWPTDSTEEEKNIGSCHGLSQQIAILTDGTVTPCCLDANGEVSLGNIFQESLSDILLKEKTVAITEGFKSGRLVAPLCKKCTFIKKFKVRNN